MKYKITKIIVLIGFLFSFGLLNAQSENESILKKDDVIIELFYGTPVINIFDKAPDPKTIDNSFGVVGLRLEFLTSKHFGFGIEGSYMSANATERIGNLMRKNENEISPPIDADSLISYNFSVFRLMPRVDFHLVTNEKMDLNIGVGIGTIVMNSDKISLPDGSQFHAREKPDFPMTVRIFFGGKYFINEHIGIGISSGFGGGYIVKTALIVKL